MTIGYSKLRSGASVNHATELMRQRQLTTQPIICSLYTQVAYRT